GKDRHLSAVRTHASRYGHDSGGCAILTRMNTTNIIELAELLQSKALLAEAKNLPDQADDPTPITGADCDSRVVGPGHIFVCKGAAFKPAYLQSALDAGAVAYLCDEQHASELAAVAPGVPALVCTDIRSAMAVVSAQAWGHPDKHMQVVGITGTKGKTTVCYFVRAILDGAQPRSHAATLGTLETYDGIEQAASKNTTPEAPDLWRHLAHAASKDLDMVMEVSSQGLKYQRVDGLSYDVAAFLNIGIDHVSDIEHPTFEDYLNSKLMIFRNAQVAVVNARYDMEPERIHDAAQVCPKVVTFSLEGGPYGDGGTHGGTMPDVWASDVRATLGGLQFVAHTPAWTAPVSIGLTGAFNVENALAAIAIAQGLGCSQEQIAYGLAHCRVPGRMDIVPSADGSVTAIVDYAHNGMAVQKVLSTVRQSYPDHYLVAVFGATGGKGAERRFEMPPAAAPYADHLIFTEDDPGPEPVEHICEQMREATPAGTSCEVILDRSDAIRRGIQLARECGRPAVVCVLGKGHEDRQLRAGGPAPMVPDGEFVRTLL
ncbi:MAG: UDP-N-acetylmuramoyl-L-alanyl-D-glutamate--2,6-diaminopimelate ligase, partial [Atopobiaceae bacterium]|nr:UDP-N-acetylmuramoyl-L-alanyl-D-glutamate--2,6-diaminopimelate ligase [Atopobiaceae bacterium]